MFFWRHFTKWHHFVNWTQNLRRWHNYIVSEKHKNNFSWMSVASWCSACFCAVLCVCFCTGRFVMVPFNLTCLHCLQHIFFEHHFNLYFYYIKIAAGRSISDMDSDCLFLSACLTKFVELENDFLLSLYVKCFIFIPSNGCESCQ